MGKIPVLLLKTKSTPTDAYEDTLRSASDNEGSDTIFEPRFVPTLRHRFDATGLGYVESLLQRKAISTAQNARFGGIIFTSQRAVEAFSLVIQQGKGDSGWPHLSNVPIYSVGPATTRALAAINTEPPLQVFGEHTGNGEALAHFILEHYGEWYRGRELRPTLLFLVGEQRRDIIPSMLRSPRLKDAERICVAEIAVYATFVMESFPREFTSIIRETSQEQERWIVVFSPTGCECVLRRLDWLDPRTCKVKRDRRDGRTFIATIGPTTRAHLVDQFGFQPDVSAESPSPDGILQSILGFRSHRGLN